MKLLVLGIGNVVMNDDGAGALVVRELEKYDGIDENLHVVEGGTLGFDLLPKLEWADRMIIVDAVDVDQPAGTVIKIENDDIEPIFESKLSPHQMGMKDLLLTAEFAGYRPPEVTLYGIQLKSIELEMKISPEVEANMPKLKKYVEEEILAFLESRKAAK